MKKLFLLTLLTALYIPLRAENYWQQYVHYSISCTLETNTHKIFGSETLEYTNNSPDTLREVYFRLYWNIFTYGSYAQKTQWQRKSFLKDSSGGIWLRKFALQENGTEKNLEYEVDNTLLRATLPSPLLPKEKITFVIDWNENIPTFTMRTGHVGRDYNIAQWYPQIATYDKFGWHKDQYIGAEFHNEFGTFDVNITLPKSFIVGYSGTLLNPQEVLPDSAIQKLKSSEGNDSTVNILDYSQREIPKEDSALVTWKCRIDTARDFAWSANENYIWDVAHWNGIAIHALYFDDKKEFWKRDAEYGRHAIKFFSENFGMYPYPNAFCVEGVIGGGMEYPGIVFLGHIGDEISTALYDVTAHEFGHEWYPMMMGNNETEYAFMDEGFTTFITTLAHEDFYGRNNNSYFWNARHHKFFAFPNSDERQDNVRNYLNIAKLGVEEPIATHADHWDETIGSGTAFYPKTASVMFMLQYVLGDSVFSQLMLEYYKRWKFKHPYPEDFYTLAMEVSGNRDLRWFFDEWFHRTYTCDYALDCVDYEKINVEGKEIYQTKVMIRKIGRAIMPLDVELQLEDGSKQTVFIPVEKWMNNETEQTVKIDLPSKPIKGEINPDKRIADINRLNNTWRKFPVKFEYDNTAFSITPMYEYSIRWRQSLWFNDIDGMKLGGKIFGSYLNDIHSFTAWSWIGVKSKQLDYDVSYSTIMYELLKWSSVSFRAYTIDGRQSENIAWNVFSGKHYSYPPFHTINVSLSRFQLVSGKYLSFNNWDAGQLNRMITRYFYQNRGDGWNFNCTFALESDVLQSDFRYNKFSVQATDIYNLPMNVRFGVRLFGGVANGNVPKQTALYLASGSPIDEMNADLLRSRGTLPDSIRFHSLQPGGGNLRGYFNQNISAERIGAANIEVRFPQLVPFIPFQQIPLLGKIFGVFNGVAFFDCGKIWNESSSLHKQFLYDAGYGIRFAQIPTQTNLFSSIGLNVIRLDFPLYVNQPIDGKKTKFRWLLTVTEIL
jgi:aminopeptidase N